jgi:multiple sugar transport system substrate-binding protein
MFVSSSQIKEGFKVMKSWKILPIAVGCAVAGGSLVACSSSASEGGGSGPVSLTFQAFGNTPEGQTANKSIVDAWNKDHPDTHINLVMTPIDSVYDKLSTQAAGGTLPDIFMDDAQDVRQYVEQGYVADLKGHVANATVDSIDPGVRDTVQINKVLAGVPIEMQTYVVFANRGLFKSAGQAIPTGASLKWDDFEKLAKATTSSNAAGLTWGLKSPTSAFVSLGLGFDAKYFTGQGKNAKIQVGDNEMAIPNRVKKMIDAGYVDKKGVSQASADVLPTFYAGKAAMLLQQSYHIANTAADAPKSLDWVVLPPLEGTNGTQQAAVPQTISVSAESKHLDQATQFLDFFMNAKNLADLNLAEGLIPPTQAGRDALAKLTATKNGWAAILKSGENLVPAPASAATNYPGWKSTVANPSYQQFLQGAIDESQLKTQLTDGWK